MSKPVPLPFQNLALSLSGGGYRAAAFHLGTLSYLNHAQWQNKPLLQQLAVISTISGGTIAGMKYCLCLAEGKSFEAYFQELYAFLKKDNLLADALAILNDSKAWQGSLKQRNLINAFAQVYHRQLLDQKTFGMLQNLPHEKFPEMVFNSTDLENQKAFRFQKSRRGLIGNGMIDVQETAAREIRLADIVASSSCFPGGFEPLNFHLDFVASDKSPLAEAWKEMQPLRLMDGGIVDNQGIESVLLFEGRMDHDGQQPFIGTWLISDVTRKELNFANAPGQESNFFLNFSIRFYNSIALTVLTFSVMLLVLYDRKWITMLSTFLMLISSMWLAAGYFIVKSVVGQLKKTVSKHASSIRNLGLIRSVKLKYVVAQVDTRINSLGRLPDVFMKRIRDQGYDNLYSDHDWRTRVKTNLIYDLLEKVPVSDELKVHVEKANQMGTTLWFSDEASGVRPSMLDALVISGQATVCANLIKYLEDVRKNLYPKLPESLRAELDAFQASCRRDFERFNAEPGWMVHELS